MEKYENLILGSGVSFSKTPDVAKKVILSAIESGIYKFDTAPSYHTESLLGQIFSELYKQNIVCRDDIYIQTKIDPWQMQNGNITDFVKDALKKLNSDYLDAFLIHWPIPEYMDDTWKSMEELKNKGIVKRIGICNLRIRQLKMYLDFHPDIIQIERHPLNIFSEEVDFCHCNNIEIQAYSPLCKMDSKIKDSSVIKEIAEKYGKDQGQIVLRWHIDTGVIPIFTSTKPERVESYSSLDDFSLTKEEIHAISSLNENYKMYLESMTCPGF